MDNQKMIKVKKVLTLVSVETPQCYMPNHKAPGMIPHSMFIKIMLALPDEQLDKLITKFKNEKNEKQQTT